VDAAFFKKLSRWRTSSSRPGCTAWTHGWPDTRWSRSSAGLGIGEKRVGRPIEQMSRGMQQKVAIARALLTSPSLLLLDEPTTGLDPRSKGDVQTFIEELQATHDASIVLTTHDLDEAERLCGSITVLAAAASSSRTARWPPGRRERTNGSRRDPPRRVHDPHRPLARRRRRGRGRGEDNE